MNRPSRAFITRLALLVAGAFAARVAFLTSYLPTRDDYLVVLTADNYIGTGQPFPIMPFHPVLRNLLTELSLALFGRGAVGAKFFSIALGTLLVAAVALFVRSTISDERAGLIAGLLTAVDVLLIDYSRQGIQEVHEAFFAVAACWLVVEAFRARATRSWRWMLPLAGVLFGFAASSKLYALAPLVVSFLVLAVSSLRKRRWDDLMTVVASLVVIPLTVFLLTYAPWFARGYDFSEWVGFQRAALDAMTSHAKPAIGWFANSHPYLWFVRPFYAYGDHAYTAYGRQLAVGLGNPFVWLAVLPAAAFSLANAGQRRRDWLLHLFFWAAYLPLAFSPRPVWLLSAVSVVPFAFGLMASVLASAERGRWTKMVRGYLAVVLVTSALLYPLAIGRALDVGYLSPIVRNLGLDAVLEAQGAGSR